MGLGIAYHVSFAWHFTAWNTAGDPIQSETHVII